MTTPVSEGPSSTTSAGTTAKTRVQLIPDSPLYSPSQFEAPSDYEPQLEPSEHYESIFTSPTLERKMSAPSIVPVVSAAETHVTPRKQHNRRTVSEGANMVTPVRRASKHRATKSEAAASKLADTWNTDDFYMGTPVALTPSRKRRTKTQMDADREQAQGLRRRVSARRHSSMTQEKLLALRSRAKNLLTKQIQQTMPEDVPEETSDDDCENDENGNSEEVADKPALSKAPSARDFLKMLDIPPPDENISVN